MDGICVTVFDDYSVVLAVGMVATESPIGDCIAAGLFWVPSASEIAHAVGRASVLDCTFVPSDRFDASDVRRFSETFRMVCVRAEKGAQ